MPFLSLLSAAATNLINWPEPGVTLVCSWKCFPSGSARSLKLTSTFRFRRKVCLQLSGSALASGERPDLRDLTGDLRSHRDDMAVRRLNCLHDARMNRLTHSFHTDLLIQSHLQWRAPRHPEVRASSNPWTSVPAGVPRLGKLRNRSLLSFDRA